MGKVVSVEQMRDLDRRAVEEYNLPGVLLMENAGIAVAKVVYGILPLDGSEKGSNRVAVFAGKGNNGGDAFVAARHLINHGYDVRMFLLCHPDDIQGDALTNWQILRKMGLRYQMVLGERDLNVARVGLINSALVVDGIFGTGYQGKMDDICKEMIRLINESNRPVVAIDVPSGIVADTGAIEDICIHSTKTVTMALPKVGLYLEPATTYVGDLVIGDISMPASLWESAGIMREVLDADFAKTWLPKRSLTCHKGDFGHVLLVGASKGLNGSAILAAKGALKAGAGLLTAAVPKQLADVFSVALPEAMTMRMNCSSGGTIAASGIEDLTLRLENKTLVIGPGLGRTEDSEQIVCQLLAAIQSPAVVDADGLYALKNYLPLLKGLEQTVVLTPHVGEMAYLTGTTPAYVQEHRLQVAEEFAKEYGVVLVLKGARTIIADKKGRVFINPTGNPGLATGGSGDLLAGIIGGLLAQKITPTVAAALGVYLHGYAADLACARLGQWSMLPSDVADFLGQAMLALSEK